MSGHRAAPHMLRFQCLGSACEDTCCKDWEVPLSEEDIERLARGIGQREADAMVKRIPNVRGRTLVVLNKLDDGRCSKLDDKQLCTLHATHGPDVLPTVCHNYPRAVGRIGDEHELTGRLSCPEVARLALLGDEPTLAEAPADAFDRVKVRLQVSPDESPYLAPFQTVRDTLTALCVAPGFPTASRLYFITHLAQRLGEFYHRDIETLDRERLAAELERITDPDVQAELHRRRTTSSPMDDLALQVAVGLVYSRAAADNSFEHVARKAATTHAAAAGAPLQDSMMKQLTSIGTTRIGRAHQTRRGRLAPEQAARLDECLARYCRSYWLQDWYSQAPNLMEHAMLLVLRVTMLRFLLVAHPDIRPDADATTFDKAAIEVFYELSRAYDHNASIREGLAKMLEKQGMLTVDHAAALLAL